jgi:AcrR family transcriptional regulator
MVQALSRRDRLRAATAEEIRQTARAILVSRGAEAVSLRAIARQMGMTAPALYRYFDSHEDLIHHVIADIFTELSDAIAAAIEVAGAASGGDVTDKVVAACRAFRGWALAHKDEFALIFGSPLPGIGHVHDHMPDDIRDSCGRKFGQTFFALFFELWQRSPFPVPAPEEMDPGLREQLERYQAASETDLPVGAVLVYLRCWVRLYGIVALEVFGHMSFALEDPAPMFEIALAELAELVGLDYRPPR